MKRLLRYRKTVGWARCTYAEVAVSITYHHQVGLLFNPKALWIGAHYGEHHKRWCINILPCLTVWWTKPGGYLP